MIDYKQQIAAAVNGILEGVSEAELAGMLEVPANSTMGDFSLPCFKLSKALRKAPQAIAEDIRDKLTRAAPDFLNKAVAVSGYVNVYVDEKMLAAAVLQAVLQANDRYGSDTIGTGRTIVIDYSSPNIAKPFHVGHLRSTMIGKAIYNIYEFLGYKCVGINHLGDWGTQFGKLIVAYRMWGSKEAVETEGITELLRIYVKFHDEAEKQPQLEDEARAEFAKLEQGGAEACRLWNWFKEISLKEFNRIYELLGVSFDSDAGESFYIDKTLSVLRELDNEGLLEEDDGAKLVRLESFNMPNALMVKKDGSTLYHTRDVAAVFYRKHTYDFEKCIYVTGTAQNLHFQQLFKIIELMGCDWSDRLVHVGFGQVSLEGAKLSTRKGTVVMLEDLLRQSIEKTREIIESKNPDLDNKEEVARQVGVGAIVFNDLSTNRIKDVEFSWAEVLNFEGETGPYVQYTHARACSLLRKAADKYGAATAEGKDIDTSQLAGAEAQTVLKELYVFPERVKLAMEKLEPSLISRYLVDLAQSFNRFYHECPIVIDDMIVRQARLALVRSVTITLRNGLKLIGLAAPEKI